MRPNASRLVVAASGISIACVAGSCKHVAPPFARLESTVVSDRYTGSPTRANVRVVRGDSVVAPSISMRLQKGDSITTSSTTRVQVTFAAGYEVTLDTSTAIYIENPSIFLRIGQAFIRKLLGAKDTLTTHTPQAVLHDVGTEYIVSVTPSATAVRVAEGVVEASTREGSYPPTRYSALEGGQIITGAPPRRMAAVSRDQLETQLRWVRQVDRVSKIPVPRVDSLTEAQARDALQRAGLRVLFVMQRESDTYAPGRVLETTPGAGQTVAPGAYVTLVVAKAPRSGNAGCTVPNITEKKESEAKRLLEAARLKGESTRRSGDVDVVTSQVEKAGSKVPCGSVVHYTWGRSSIR